MHTPHRHPPQFNCEREHNGRKTFPCKAAQTIKECTQHAMDETVYNGFGVFKNRVHALCFQYQHELFAQRSEETNQKLRETAEQATEHLARVQQTQEALKRQQDALAEQAKGLRLQQAKAMVQQDDILTQSTRIQDSLEATAQNMTDFEGRMVNNMEQSAGLIELIERGVSKIEVPHAAGQTFSPSASPAPVHAASLCRRPRRLATCSASPGHVIWQLPTVCTRTHSPGRSCPIHPPTTTTTHTHARTPA